jgi:mono/diheme cytochrome c family protein
VNNGSQQAASYSCLEDASMRTALLITAIIFAISAFTQNMNYVPDPAWKAPSKAAEKRNPLTGVPDALHHGHDLFEAQCSMCHGSDGRGLANAANFHMPAVQRQTDGTLFWKMTNGNPEKGMPSFRSLSDTDRWSLVCYLRMFKAGKTGKKAMTH